MVARRSGSGSKRMVGVLLVSMTLGLLVALPANASDWEQETAYSDVAVTPDDELRFAATGGELGVHVLDRDGNVLRTIEVPAQSVDLDGEFLVVSGPLSGYPVAEPPFVSLTDLEGNVLVQIRWPTAVQLDDVAIIGSTVLVASGEVITVLDLDLLPVGEIHPSSDYQWEVPAGWRHVTLGAYEETLLVSWDGNSNQVEVFENLTSIGLVSLSFEGYVDGITDLVPGPGNSIITNSNIYGSIDQHPNDGSPKIHLDSGDEHGWYTGFDIDGCGGLVAVVHPDLDHILYGSKLFPEGRDPGCFVDSLTTNFMMAIEWIGREGITQGCNPPDNDRFCPDDFVTRGEMAVFLVRALDYTDNGGGNLFTDDDGLFYENSADRLKTAKVTLGCNPPANDKYCGESHVTRGQTAAFLVRAMGYVDNGGGDLFVDDDGHIFENAIDKLGTAKVTLGCNPPTNDRFCPDDFVTRGQMAAFLKRALG